LRSCATKFWSEATAVAGAFPSQSASTSLSTRHDAARLEEEQRQQRPLFGAAERDRLGTSASLERTEDGEFDHRRRF
jgi:hypothetical protein